jgi:hypothetical protein
VLTAKQNDPAAQFVLSGWPTGHAADMSYVLTPLEGGAAVAQGAGVPTFIEQPAGSGSYVMTVDTTGVLIGTYEVSVTNGVVTVSSEMAVESSGYPTVEQLVAASSRDALTDLDRPQQDALRAAAIREVERYCRQSFVADVGVTVQAEGTGTDMIYLPRRAETITSVVVGGNPLDLDGNLELGPDGDLVRFLPPDMSYAMVATRVPGDLSRRVFPWRARVDITGTFGWLTVPGDVVDAIRYDMEDQAATDASGLAQTVAMAQMLGIRDQSQGNMRVTLDSGNRGRTLSPRAEGVLRDLVWTGPPGYVV